VCLTLIKKKKRKVGVSVDTFYVEGSENNTAFSDEALNLLYDAIKTLKEIDRIIILMYLEEKPYKEIAEITGTTPNNIAVRITRIKEQLKKRLHGKIN
jgi:RNA polymerase sigma-70 factor (ECF subfamily)